MACPGTSMPPWRFASSNRSPSRCATSTKKFERPEPASSAAEENVQEQRQHQAQQQARDDRKVEVDIATIDRDITGQFAEIGNAEPEGQEQPDDHDEAPDDDEELADLRHTLILTAPAMLPSPCGGRSGRGL